MHTSSPNISGNQHPAVTSTELSHNFVTLLLVHISVHATHREVALSHLVGQPTHLRFGVAEDHRLRNRQRVIQVTQRIELPLLLVDLDEELLDALQCQLISLHQYTDWVVHELVGHVQNLLR